MIFDTLPFEKPQHQKMAIVHGFTIHMYVLSQGFQAVEISTRQTASTTDLTQLKSVVQRLLMHENIMHPWIQQDERHLNLLFQAPASFNFALKLMNAVPDEPHYSAEALATAFKNANQKGMIAPIGDDFWRILEYLEDDRHLQQLTNNTIQKFIRDLDTRSRAAEWFMPPRVRFERLQLRRILQDELDRRETFNRQK